MNAVVESEAVELGFQPRGKAGMLAKALGLDVPVEIVRRITEFAERA